MAVKAAKPIQGPTYTYNNKEDKYYESIGGVNPEWEMSERDAQAYRASGGNVKTSAQQAYERMLAQQRAARQSEYSLGQKTLNSNAFRSRKTSLRPTHAIAKKSHRTDGGGRINGRCF